MNIVRPLFKNHNSCPTLC